MTQSTAEFWNPHIHAWQNSGLSKKAYCQQHELPVHQFQYWYRKGQGKFSKTKLIKVEVESNQPVMLVINSELKIECQPDRVAEIYQSLKQQGLFHA